MYSDLTGIYPIILIRVNQYIFVCYDYDTNIIQEKSTKTHNAAEIQYTEMSMLKTLTTSGNQPNIHILDNQASSILRQGLLNNNIKHQLVRPYLHRQNSSERLIQKFKAYFITCLCADNPGYSEK